MKNKILNISTRFINDVNRAEIKKANIVKIKDQYPTPIHGDYFYSETSAPKLDRMIITGKYLAVAEKNIFKEKHKILKSLDKIDLENFQITLWSMNISSLKKMRKYCKIPGSQKNFGILGISYEKVKSKERIADEFHIDFDVMLEPSEFKKITYKLLNKKKNFEYNFLFKVKSNVDYPPENMVYGNAILDFKIAKHQS